MKIAIYSRKSKFTGKGESIENQIQLCKNYALTRFDVKDEDIYIYEDEGFSGGNTDRPQFQSMLQDAKKKKFDILICYRLDRVSRNIADFSKLIEELQANNISFVSIREQFDTSTPMGRAMMYISSVFAQLERETIAERIRDNMLQLAKTGRWLGGIPPLGFEAEKTIYVDDEFKERSLVKLILVNEEMELVNSFYDKYLELGSIHKLRKYLIQNNYKTKNDAYYSSRVLSDILRNPAYVQANDKVIEYLESKGIVVAGKDKINNRNGILIYNKTNKSVKNDTSEWIAAIAKHNGVICAEKWLEVQKQLDKNNMEIPRTGTSEIALLSGILRCKKCGSAMNVMYGAKRKDGTRPHYYVCNLKTISGLDKCDNRNVNGIDIEHTVINKLLSLAKSKETLLSELEAIKKDKKALTDTKLLDELKNRKIELLDEINNLVNEISKSAVASKYILPQIESKDKELKEIEDNILKLEEDIEKDDSENLDFIIKTMLDFAKLFDVLDNEQKKYFIQIIVDKVYWDGERVFIKLFLDNPSKFRSTSSWGWNKTEIVLHAKLNLYHRHVDDPESTLGEKIRKQRKLKRLTAGELGKLCGCSKNTIYSYESNTAIPHHTIMKNIIDVLGVDVDYFEDDYYSFIFSDNYTDKLKKWRKENTTRVEDIKNILGVSYVSFLSWEKGKFLSREVFNKIKGKF